MDQELFARFRKCAVEVLSVDEGKVVPEAKFGDDLDADSLDLVELVMALEEEFGVEVPEEDLEGVETVGQAYDLVVASSDARRAAAGSPSPGSASLRRAGSARTPSGRVCSVRRRPAATSSVIADWDPSPWFDNPKEARRADRVQQFALAAAAEAFDQAGELDGRPRPQGRHLRHRRRRPPHARGAGRGPDREGTNVGSRPFLVPMMMANARGAVDLACATACRVRTRPSARPVPRRPTPSATRRRTDRVGPSPTSS